ncbi:MAG: hypothetical protein IJH39_04045 [Clostridia bacterium]|nr:hypothetical protein [Clostridia bacterium]
MVNVGENNITVYIGDTEISAIYAGDVQIYPNSTANLTGISIDNVTWVVDIPYSGGNATSANCTFTVTGYYDDGRTRNITSKATITPSPNPTTISPTTAETRELVGAYKLVASYSGFTDESDYIHIYQEAYQPCNPLVLVNNLGNTNNQGYSFSQGYLFDYGVTAITPCDFNFNGIKSICARNDSFYTNPRAMLGRTDNSGVVADDGCIQTIKYFEADCSGVTNISYPFGNDDTNRVSQSLTAATFTNTDSVTILRQLVRYCTNIVSLRLGNLSKVSTVGTPQFYGNNYLTDITVDALPNLNMSQWGWNNCTALTETSLINILNALPTASGKTITLGTTNLNKLTSAEGQTALANARSKGWTVN